MKKKLLVTLEIDVEDLSDIERQKCAELVDVEISDLPDLSEVESAELADLVTYVLTDNPDTFAGSDIYARFTDVYINEVKWIK